MRSPAGSRIVRPGAALNVNCVRSGPIGSRAGPLVTSTMAGTTEKWIRSGRGRQIGAALAALVAVVAAGCTRSAPALAVKRDVVATLRLAGNVIAPPTAVYTAYPPYQTTVKKVDASVNE